jgi:hypothetical protein
MVQVTESSSDKMMTKECESSSTEEEEYPLSFHKETYQCSPVQRKKLPYLNLALVPPGIYGLTPRKVIYVSTMVWLFYLLPGTKKQVLFPVL